ncbi:hypothetical protein Tco_1458742 [Tanacetum coccineum]|uniref:Uncharacterized protein n=1 Tax=Tanacetum coccineum TaxID=301880 RepID=A0ABQ5BY08_9ASTR
MASATSSSALVFSKVVYRCCTLSSTILSIIQFDGSAALRSKDYINGNARAKEKGGCMIRLSVSKQGVVYLTGEALRRIVAIVEVIVYHMRSYAKKVSEHAELKCCCPKLSTDDLKGLDIGFAAGEDTGSDHRVGVRVMLGGCGLVLMLGLYDEDEVIGELADPCSASILLPNIDMSKSIIRYLLALRSAELCDILYPLMVLESDVPLLECLAFRQIHFQVVSQRARATR